jgi:hypothetical protein
MRLHAARLDVRGHAVIASFGKRSDSDDELRRHRKEGDDAEQPAS